RRQRIRRLARLADRQDQRPVIDVRIAVTELRRVLDVDGDSRELLEHVLADQAGMPRGAACRDDDPLEGGKLVIFEVQPAELHRAILLDRTTTHRLTERLRLLEDLLQHEVIVAALLDGIQVPLDVRDLLRHLGAAQLHRTMAFRCQHGDLTIVQVDHLARLRQHGSDVARDVVVVFLAYPAQQRTALARSHQLVRVAAAHDRQPVRAFDLLQRGADGLLERVVVRLLDEVNDHLRVRLTLEGMTQRLQLAPERARILDDTVVNDRELRILVHVRVRIHLRRRAVRRPPGVGDADRAVRLAPVRKTLLELRDLSDRLADVELPVLEHTDPRRVVPPVLESAEPLDQQWRSRALTDVADNATHDSPDYSLGRCPVDHPPPMQESGPR